jgi:hypothetical protein
MYIITNLKSKFLSDDDKFVGFTEFESIKMFSAYITAAEYMSKRGIDGEVISVKHFCNLLLAYYRSKKDEELFKELRDQIETLEIKVEELTKLNINLLSKDKKEASSITRSRRIPL